MARGTTAIPTYAPCPRPDEAISNRNRHGSIEILSWPEHEPSSGLIRHRPDFDCTTAVWTSNGDGKNEIGPKNVSFLLKRLEHPCKCWSFGEGP